MRMQSVFTMKTQEDISVNVTMGSAETGLLVKIPENVSYYALVRLYR